jgi:hypothetical protein
MDKSGLMKNLVAAGPGGVAKLQQVSEEAMEVLKKKIAILKHENTDSAERMAAAEKVNIIAAGVRIKSWQVNNSRRNPD